MPTYAKSPKVIQDFGLGIQSVNRAADNEQALRDAYDVEHIVNEPKGVSSVFTPFTFGSTDEGHHDSVLIPRAIATVATSTVTPYPGFTQNLYWFEIRSTITKEIGASSITRFGSGAYYIKLVDADATATYIEAAPSGTGSVTRIASTRFTSQLQGAPQTGVLVQLLELDTSSGQFALADYDFSLTLFSR